MAHEHSLHGVIPRAAVTGAAVGEAGYTWLALATVLTWLPKRAVRHDLVPWQATFARLVCGRRRVMPGGDRSCEDDQMPPRLPAVDPARLAQWCEEQLGSPPAGEIFRSGHLSAVIGLRLADSRMRTGGAGLPRMPPSAANRDVP